MIEIDVLSLFRILARNFLCISIENVESIAIREELITEMRTDLVHMAGNVNPCLVNQNGVVNMKSVLVLSAAANMIQQFNKENILLLKSLGLRVHVATNFKKFGSMSLGQRNELLEWLKMNNVVVHQVDFERGLGTLFSNVKAYLQVNSILKNDEFKFVHVHSPLGSIIGRLAAKRNKVKTVYTAHGFHFFKGSPKRNWIVFYPIEKLFSTITDTLIVINNEDYEVAKKFYQKNLFKISGVGVDVQGAKAVTDLQYQIRRESTRKALEIEENEFMVFSTGELSDRKNHKVVLEAISKIEHNENIHYFIAGVGQNKEQLLRLAQSLGLEERFHLLGYRTDIFDLNAAADVNIFPSLREGLGLSGLEAILARTYLIGNEKTAMAEYITPETGSLFDGQDVNQLKRLLEDVMAGRNVVKRINYDDWMKFDKNHINSLMSEIYRKVNEE